MSEEKNEVVETALVDLGKGSDLEDILGLVYDHGRLDAAMQISESDNPGNTAEAIQVEMYLQAMLEAAVRADD